MAPSIAAERAGKARMFEHRDVRVRAGSRPARSAGESSQPDVGETVMPGANGFGYFPRKESNPRRGTARKRHGCPVSTSEKTHFVRSPSPAALRAATSPTRGDEDPSHWVPAFAGMTTNCECFPHPAKGWPTR